MINYMKSSIKAVQRFRAEHPDLKEITVKKPDILLLRKLAEEFGPESFPGRGIHYLFAWLIDDYRKLRGTQETSAPCPSSPSGQTPPPDSDGGAKCEQERKGPQPGAIPLPSDHGTSLSFTVGGPMVVKFDEATDPRMGRLLAAGFHKLDDLSLASSKAVLNASTARMVAWRTRAILAGIEFNVWMKTNPEIR
jgi:hypothetical protein